MANNKTQKKKQVHVGVVCIKVYPGSDDDEDDIPIFPPSLDAPYPGDLSNFPPPPFQ